MESDSSRTWSKWSLRFDDPRIEEVFKNRRLEDLAAKIRWLGVTGICFTVGTIALQRQWKDDADYDNAEQAEVGRMQFQINIAFVVLMCVIVGTTKVPFARERMGTFGLEVFFLAFMASTLAYIPFVMREYLAKVLGYDPDEVFRGLSITDTTESLYLLETDIVITGMHMLVPVRWYLLVPMQVLALLVFSFAGVLMSEMESPQLQVHILGFAVLLFLASYGKRSFEIQERVMFTLVVHEKTKRVEAEFQLEHANSQLGPAAHEGDSPRRPPPPSSAASTGVTGAIFAGMANADLEGTDSKALEKLLELGRREKWTVDPGALQLDPRPVLGVGGFGCVLAGTMHGTPVALKIPRGAATADVLTAMWNELRLLRHIRHPNIVAFHGLVRHTSSQFGLVLERVYGLELQKCVAFLDNMLAVQVTLGVCRAIRYLHSQEPLIIHGDLKPENVMVDLLADKAVTKVIDFGLSRHIHKGILGGTRLWISPEQLLDPGMPPSHTVDVFAFGAVAYFIQTRHAPMYEVEREHILQSTLGRPELPAPILDFLPDSALKATMECLLFDPKRRACDLSNVQAHLEEIPVAKPLCESGASSLSETASLAGNLSEKLSTSVLSVDEVSMSRMRLYRATVSKEFSAIASTSPKSDSHVSAALRGFSASCGSAQSTSSSPSQDHTVCISVTSV